MYDDGGSLWSENLFTYKEYNVGKEDKRNFEAIAAPIAALARIRKVTVISS